MIVVFYGGLKVFVIFSFFVLLVVFSIVKYIWRYIDIRFVVGRIWSFVFLINFYWGLIILVYYTRFCYMRVIDIFGYGVLSFVRDIEIE